MAVLYREGRGVPKDDSEATRLLKAAALADNLDAEVEYGIALFNGTGTEKNEATAAKVLRRAALQGSPIAQNRLAHLFMSGRGVAVDPIAAMKRHIIAKAGGLADTGLDEYTSKQSAEARTAAEAAARPWVRAIAMSRS